MTTFSKPENHIFRRMDKDMRKLQKRVLKMGAMVLEQMDRLQNALAAEDPDKARQVIEGDRPIDLQEVKVDKFVIQFLARRAPMGSDLRFVVATSRIVTELERIGDETAQVAKALFHEQQQLAGCDGRPADEEVRELVGQLIVLFDSALDAYQHYDYQEALALAREESGPGYKLREQLKELMECIFHSQQPVAEAATFVLVLRALERIMRHVQNIAEHVIYLVSGEDIRHQ